MKKYIRSIPQNGKKLSRLEIKQERFINACFESDKTLMPRLNEWLESHTVYGTGILENKPPKARGSTSAD